MKKYLIVFLTRLLAALSANVPVPPLPVVVPPAPIEPPTDSPPEPYTDDFWAALRVRNDRHGLGHYGAPRSRGTRKHKGIDYVVQPGEPIPAPVTMRAVRISRPYKVGNMTGMIFDTEYGYVRIFYLLPSVPPGATVKKGETIGIAQNVAGHHNLPDMKPHIHVEWITEAGHNDPSGLPFLPKP